MSERTLRTDRGGFPPLVHGSGIGCVVIRDDQSYCDRHIGSRHHYLTPFYSPVLSTSCVEGSSHFGTPFGDLPVILPLRFEGLPFLLVFRLDLLLLTAKPTTGRLWFRRPPAPWPSRTASNRRDRCR